MLSNAECWQILSGRSLGRLATSIGVFRSTEGAKLITIVMNNLVAFESDDHDNACGWSVIVKGKAHILETFADIQEAEDADLRSWIPTLKQRFVRIVPSEITGRRYTFGFEPDRESSFA